MAYFSRLIIVPTLLAIPMIAYGGMANVLHSTHFAARVSTSPLFSDGDGVNREVAAGAAAK